MIRAITSNYKFINTEEEIITKNMNTKTGKSELKGIEFKSLIDLTETDKDKNSFLCPIKCVKVYIKTTKVKEEKKKKKKDFIT